MDFIGLDAGSVSVKAVVIDSGGTILQSRHQAHKGQPLVIALAMLRSITSGQFTDSPESRFSLSLTGSAGRLLGEILGIPPVNEVVAFAYGTRRLYPHIRTIIQLGGEDAQFISLDGDSFSPQDFSMNSVCAAGTGSFLDQQAERLRLSIDEFSELGLRSQTPPPIAGRCSVFAKSDMIHLQQIATPVEDIVSGLCFAVARNFRGSIARGRELVPPVSLQGGVAANRAMVRAFSEVFGIDDLFVPEEFAHMGAIGAALKDLHGGAAHPFNLGCVETFLRTGKNTEKGYQPLLARGDDFARRHPSNGNGAAFLRRQDAPGRSSLGRAFLGVDVGSISTNLAVVDDKGTVLAKRYLMTAGRPIEAVRQGLEEIGQEVGDIVEIAGVGTTGSGRYMIADYIGADIVKNEITAQATAAAFIDRDVDTIFEIGGQDSKFISLKDGVIVDFEMNKACAAGTGSFLEEQAEKLGIAVKKEFQDLAFASTNPCRLGERCTVFMENSLMANLQRGVPREDLLAGLSYSIVQNYINRVVGKRTIGEKIFFQGGVAFNTSVVAAFEKYLGREVIVPEHHDVTGAIGMALIAMREREGGPGHQSRFKGFQLSRRPYEISSFGCKGCPNVCEINRVKVEGEQGYLYYGGRCEKYDVKRDKSPKQHRDLFRFREDALWKAHLTYLNGKRRGNGRGDAPRIGVPNIFYFHDYLPFWTTLLWELGFEVEVSPPTDRRIIDLGLEHVLAETCFPVKTALGHVKYLANMGIDTVLIPSFVNLNAKEEAFRTGYACPYTQTIPYTARVAFPHLRIEAPVVRFGLGGRQFKKEVSSLLNLPGLRPPGLEKALQAARQAQEEFRDAIRREGESVLSDLREETIVVVGRAYNSFDRGMNLDIPRKLSSLGVPSVPMDFLPSSTTDIRRDWPNMYWRAGQRILAAARIIKANPLLHALFIGNFSCGPDSFIARFFDEEMAGKPYLHLELDAHSADAGVMTRCEAFLDSIEGKRRTGAAAAPVAPDRMRKINRSARHSRLPSRRTVYIPRMSDHTFAVAAAFKRSGVNAEVLPESTRDSVDIGRRYVSGKECYPCAVTTGDMVKKVLDPGFDPEEAAFFMPSGSGPCRFGQYNVFHRMVLRELGIPDTPVLSPTQDITFYRELGDFGKDFAIRAWEGVVTIGLLTKCLHETRPYEQEQGSSDAVYERNLQHALASLEGRDGDIREVLMRARRDFESVPRTAGGKPLIGIVGEIFVRSNRFSNENLVRKIESLGGEAYLAPVEEWVYYVNLMALRQGLHKRAWSDIINLLVKRVLQRRVEHRFENYFTGFLKTVHEPGTRELLDKASPFLHDSFEGEAVLSIGKSVDLIERGVTGIVSAMPFGCMPGTIVTGLMRGLKRAYGVPALSIPYDGTESLTTDIQLEAFIDQAREFGRKRDRRPVH